MGASSREVLGHPVRLLESVCKVVGGLIEGFVCTFFALYINWSRVSTLLAKVFSTGDTHEEPHACAETGGSESVERSDGVDMDWVGAVGTGAGCWACHCGCVCYAPCQRELNEVQHELFVRTFVAEMRVVLGQCPPTSKLWSASSLGACRRR